MSATKERHHGGKEYIFKIVEEYAKLIRLSLPSDSESNRILEIMELAVYDAELNNFINREDKKYAEENNLLEDYYLYEEYSYNPKFDEIEYNNKDGTHKSKNANNLVLFPSLVSTHQEKKRRRFNVNIRNAIPCFVAAGLLSFCGITQFQNSLNHKKDTSVKYASTLQNQLYKHFSPKYARNYLLSKVNDTETEMSVCNSNNGRKNEEIKNYYVSFKQLKNQIVMKKLQSSQVKGEVRKLQVRAERQQREAERNQRYLESQKELAEVQHNYDEAQKLKDRAITALSESQQWLCLSRQALNLSIR